MPKYKHSRADSWENAHEFFDCNSFDYDAAAMEEAEEQENAALAPPTPTPSSQRKPRPNLTLEANHSNYSTPMASPCDGGKTGGLAVSPQNTIRSLCSTLDTPLHGYSELLLLDDDQSSSGTSSSDEDNSESIGTRGLHDCIAGGDVSGVRKLLRAESARLAELAEVRARQHRIRRANTRHASSPGRESCVEKGKLPIRSPPERKIGRQKLEEKDDARTSKQVEVLLSLGTEGILKAQEIARTYESDRDTRVWHASMVQLLSSSSLPTQLNSGDIAQLFLSLDRLDHTERLGAVRKPSATLMDYIEEAKYQDCVASGRQAQPLLFNERDRWGNTALVLGAQGGERHCVKMLLRHGGSRIDLKAANDQGSTALIEAVKCEHGGVARMLALEHSKRGVGIIQQDACGYTAVHWACINRRGDILTDLLEQGGGEGIDLVRSNGEHGWELATHTCARVGAWQCLDMLLNAGASPNQLDDKGRQYLKGASGQSEHHAKQGGWGAVQEMLHAVAGSCNCFVDTTLDVDDADDLDELDEKHIFD
ncbi:unnamed protein product [Chrysoparadoxa australica]